MTVPLIRRVARGDVTEVAARLVFWAVPCCAAANEDAAVKSRMVRLLLMGEYALNVTKKLPVVTAKNLHESR
jgi:hypothetical protein